MKVLFISSGNSVNGITPIIKNQGESLKDQGIDLDYYTIKGKGIFGYLKNIIPLKKILRKNSYDIVHAHYLFSALVASLAGVKPIAVSLMGSDVKSKKYLIFLIKLFYKISWSGLIVKSEDMKSTINIKNVYLLPNGVDLNQFKPIDKYTALKKTGWNPLKKHILFSANPGRKEKNFRLAKNAYDMLTNPDIELHCLKDIPYKTTNFYYNASDVIILTSKWEGSPNVIKEAMACNCPIVSTDVGDVKWLVGDTLGCLITSFDPKDIAVKIKKSLEFSENIGRTNGKDRIIELGLDSISIGEKIFTLYNKILNN